MDAMVHSRFRVGLLEPSRVFLSGCVLLSVGVLLSGCVLLGGLLFGGEAATAACRGRTCNGKRPVAIRYATDAVTITSVVDEDRASGGTFGPKSFRFDTHADSTHRGHASLPRLEARPSKRGRMHTWVVTSQVPANAKQSRNHVLKHALRLIDQRMRTNDIRQ
jgi:hypothetical protein